VHRFDRLLTVKKYANVATERYMAARETHILVTIYHTNKQSTLSTLLPRVFARAKTCRLLMGNVRTLSSDQTLCEFVFSNNDTSAGSNSPNNRNNRHARTATNNNNSNFRLTVDDVIDALSGDGIDVRVASIDEIKTAMSAPLAPLINPDCTLCIIKPHVIKEQQTTADLLQAIVQYQGGGGPSALSPTARYELISAICRCCHHQ
jgi:hypothetical protein